MAVTSHQQVAASKRVPSQRFAIKSLMFTFAMAHLVREIQMAQMQIEIILRGIRPVWYRAIRAKTTRVEEEKLEEETRVLEKKAILAP